MLLTKMLEMDLKVQINVHKRKKKIRKSVDAYHSLNKDYRRKVESQIMSQNQGMVNRLVMTKSVYNTRKWEKDHQRSKYYGHNISKNQCKPPTILINKY